MQYTPNYNLILVEGTDVVNPLVQLNPNITDIDTALFSNKQASIGSASEVASGSVHAITRANTDSNYFRFTATGDWTTGDSMTVDGSPVSVYLTDGTTPETGAYKINSEVFAMINGSRVTLFTSNRNVSGDITDVKNMIAVTEVSPSTRAYSEGEQFIYQDILYTASTAISIGDAIAPGTNCNPSDPIAEQVNALKYVKTIYTAQPAAYSTQLAQLQTAYNALSYEDKLRSVLIVDNGLYHNTALTGIYVRNDVRAGGPTSVYFDLTSHIARTWIGGTVSDISTQTDSNTIQLVVI